MSQFLDVPEENGLPACAILTDDPMRVEMFTAHYLEQARKYTQQRGMTGYIGRYAGTPLVVQAVGYGEASLVAYLHEMVSLYGVRTVIYAGECVSREAPVLLRDLVVASRAYARGNESQADGELLQHTALAARQRSLCVHTRTVHTDDRYATEEMASCCAQASLVDYATHALYEYASRHGIAAVSLLAVSERFGQQVSSAERQSQLHGLTQWVFETAALVQ
jgi:purine-nucleoside phosphorylase